MTFAGSRDPRAAEAGSTERVSYALCQGDLPEGENILGGVCQGVADRESLSQAALLQVG
jgi:hypothetical protein